MAVFRYCGWALWARNALRAAFSGSRRLRARFGLRPPGAAEFPPRLFRNARLENGALCAGASKAFPEEREARRETSGTGGRERRLRRAEKWTRLPAARPMALPVLRRHGGANRSALRRRAFQGTGRSRLARRAPRICLQCLLLYKAFCAAGGRRTAPFPRDLPGKLAGPRSQGRF